MTVTCDRDRWTSALSLLKHATLSNGSMPVLSEILVSADADRVRLSGTDLEVEIDVSLVGDGDLAPTPVSLATLIKLTKASKRKKGQSISIANTDNGLRLDIGGRTFEIEAGIVERPAGWCDTDWSRGSVQSHDSADFAGALRYCAAAVCRDPTRFHLGGIYLGDDHMVATDGHRMHVARDVESFPKGPVTVPLNAVSALSAAIASTGAPWIMARHRPGDPPLVQFHVEGVLAEALITARTIDDTFSPWQQLCQGHDNSFSVASDLWVASLSTAAKLAGTAGAWIAAHAECRVHIEGLFSEIVPLSEAADVEAQICASPRYLLEASAGDDDLVRVEYSSSKDLEPVIVRPSATHYGIVMPMRG